MKTVLIVDDSKINIDVLVGILKTDYKIGVSLNGNDALEFAKKHRPDLILLDIIMPRMDGFEVCRKLKSDPGTREIPVVFISGMDQPGQKQTCLNCGGADYITKPFESREIKTKIHTHLKQA
jgi:CheY-like chemotaxis protein